MKVFMCQLYLEVFALDVERGNVWHKYCSTPGIL